jgi:hypothetical protein
LTGWTAMTFSLAPLLQTSKMDLNRRLKLGATSAQRNPTRGILASSSVVVQVALALLLLVGAGLVARSFAYLLSLDRGFPTERLVVVEVNLTGESYRLMEQRRLLPNRRYPAEEGAVFDNGGHPKFGGRDRNQRNHGPQILEG